MIVALRALAGMFVLLLSAGASVSASDVLELSASIDETVYAEGQRIELVVCVLNRGAADFIDLAPLRPGVGYLGLRLRQLESGEDIAMKILVEPGILTRQGPTLRPGEVECDHRDLTLYFGDRRRDSTFAGRLRATSLPPGRYRLDISFEARTGFLEGLPPVHLQAAPLYFEVRPLEAFPDEATLVQRFLAGRSWPTEGLDLGKAEYCRARLKDFEGSRFFLLVYTGSRMSEVPLEYLLGVLFKQKAPAERIAAAISIRCEIDPGVEERLPGWTEGLARWKRGSVVDHYIDSLRRGAKRRGNRE